MPKIRELLNEATATLGKISPTAALDAQILLEHASGITRLKFISEPELEASEKVATSFRRMLARRAQHEPVAYITGSKDFYGAEFAVTPDVLIPRPETELLVEKALEFLKARQGSLRVLDLGTGSGCVVVTLAREITALGKAVSFVAVDKSDKALFIAQRNAKRQEVFGHITFQVSDWFSSLKAQQDQFDLIISNPPYIAQGDSRVSPDVSFEPAQALFSGPEGLDDIEVILREGPNYLKSCGQIMIETGFEQHAVIRERFAYTRSQFESYKDLAGLDRVLAITPPASCRN